ncbi:hypothetical protein BR93DRAFT_42756 [Coniochaeta sp. PMI_546]|nr:hypothetical protein BR93DRAFT_42756 [Coniochaeta sp. PMI_546]
MQLRDNDFISFPQHQGVVPSSCASSTRCNFLLDLSCLSLISASEQVLLSAPECSRVAPGQHDRLLACFGRYLQLPDARSRPTPVFWLVCHGPEFSASRPRFILLFFSCLATTSDCLVLRTDIPNSLLGDGRLTPSCRLFHSFFQIDLFNCHSFASS